MRPHRVLTRFALLALVLGGCRCGRKTGSVAPADPSARVVSVEREPSAGARCPTALTDARSGGLRPSSYQEPSDDERRDARSAAVGLFSGVASAPNVLSFGFEVVSVPEWPGTLLIRERADRRRGGGAYVVRPTSTSTLIVQAPHTFYDEGTFPLACELFERSSARALFINTVHRYKAALASPDGKHPADVAHASTSLFQAMTEGAVSAIPAVDVVQLHGFQNREASARAVVSTGERSGRGDFLPRAAAALEAAVGPRVLRYPADTSELGATTNVQGMVVRKSGGRFLHVEMDEGLRRDLLQDSAFRAKTLDALAAIFQRP